MTTAECIALVQKFCPTNPTSTVPTVSKPAPDYTHAQQIKRLREQRMLEGLCIWGCGSTSERPDGRCHACAAKDNERKKRRYWMRKELSETMPLLCWMRELSKLDMHANVKARLCMYCRKPLLQRPDELNAMFAKRRTCGKSCAGHIQ